MNKYILFIISLIFPSCMRELHVMDSVEGDRIVMSGILSTADTLHKVHLCLAKGFVLKELPQTAVVSCYINDNKVVKADSVDKFSIYSSESDNVVNRYYFKTVLSSGDKVRIEAIVGNLRAYADIKMPARAEIGDIDTIGTPVSGRRYFKNLVWRDYKISVSINDISREESFFRGDDMDFKCYFKKDGNVVSIINKKGILKLDVKDPIFGLETGRIPSQVTGSTGIDLGNINNENLIYQDKFFENGVYKLKYSIYAYDFCHVEPETEDYDQKLYPVGIFRVSTLSKDTYNFLYTYSLRGTGYPFAEPAVVFQNVQGGLGFVGAETVTEKRFEFAPVDYPGHI